MKACKKCLRDLPFSAFGKRLKSKDGLKYWCKKCCAENNAERYANNSADILEQNAEWREANPDKMREYRAKWRRNNKKA